MTITALVVRRFQRKAADVATVERVAKPLELPALPSRDMVLEFGDDTGEALVNNVRLRASGSHPPAVGPPRVEIRTKTEDGAHLPAALAAGWAPLPADSVG